jgi:2-dehydro-3-deoxyphosphooctonate aldolase (KDO 8-P synthase)
VGDVLVGGGAPLVIIAGPCVIESRDLTLEIADRLKAMTQQVGLPLIFKASWDKANRLSVNSYRGPGMEQGLAVLAQVRDETGLAVNADIHEPRQARAVAEVVDLLQIPAFLCRQTDLVLAAAATGKPVLIKKGQFLSPWDMKHIVAKARSTGNQQVLVAERGASFGYGRLVSDMRSLVILRECRCPVVFDVTHSLQMPGGAGAASGGEREYAPALARAAVAAGIDALFLETHPDPASAKSDAAAMLPLEGLLDLLYQVKALDDLVRTM